jgi:photosystem II stability/assembly factor-like uncharacterized protein
MVIAEGVARVSERDVIIGVMRTVAMIAGMLMAWPIVAQNHPVGPWQLQNSGTNTALRGIHRVSDAVAWAGGAHGSVLTTEDGGAVWRACAIAPGAEELDFRAVWAWDAQTAVAMSSGPGELSRLYKTTDGCRSWTLLYTNRDRAGFWDAIQYWNRDQGVILGDPVDGVFTVLTVSTRGMELSQALMPSQFDARNFGAFAASNSALALGGKPNPGETPTLWIGMGGKAGTKVLRLNRMNQWSDSSVPMASGSESSGIYSLSFKGPRVGVAVGGDYEKPNEAAGTAAWTDDGGRRWKASARPPHGYRSAVAWDAVDKAWIAVGTNGSDTSTDDGRTWQTLDDGQWNALSLPWIVGPKGRIAKLSPAKAERPVQGVSRSTSVVAASTAALE